MVFVAKLTSKDGDDDGVPGSWPTLLTYITQQLDHQQVLCPGDKGQVIKRNFSGHENKFFFIVFRILIFFVYFCYVFFVPGVLLTLSLFLLQLLPFVLQLIVTSFETVSP